MILIVGQRDDPHVASVTDCLIKRGRDFFVFDTFDTRSDGMRVAVSNNVILDVEGNRFDLNDVRSVWWRLKPRYLVPQESVSELYNYYFIHREWIQIWDYLTLELSSKFQINDRKFDQLASNKLLQLKLAEAIGFKVPLTLVSNNFDEIGEFINSTRHTSAIFKTLTPYMSPDGMLAYSTIIDTETLGDKRALVKAVPGIFQEFIAKSFELRITIVGNHVFAARIESEYSTKTRVDWREDIYNTSLYSEYTLESQFVSQILVLHKEFGLIYGAYDFIVDKNDNYFFLEVNPVGQWMWLEQALGFPISERIADALALGEV